LDLSACLCKNHAKWSRSTHPTGPYEAIQKWGGNKVISWRGKGVYTSLVTFYVYTSSYVLHWISYIQGGGGKMKEGELDSPLQFLLFNSHPDKRMKKSPNSYFVEGGGLPNVLLHQNFILKGE
jgi:hypothetical protein